MIITKVLSDKIKHKRECYLKNPVHSPPMCNVNVLFWVSVFATWPVDISKLKIACLLFLPLPARTI